MAKDFVIVTDATSDLPKDYVTAENVHVVNMSYTIDSKSYTSGDPASPVPHEFYQMMRSGLMATTALINPLTAKEAAEKHLKQGKDVLYIAFSSALSGSCESAIIAAKELNDIYKDNKVIVVDSLCASLGEGLLVYLAVEHKKKGHTLQETAEYVEGIRQNICHYFTVNDLFHLHRGGRVSKSKALVGTLLKIKPLLYVNEEGRLIPLKNVMGRKKALAGLASSMQEKLGDIKNDIVFISHGDCIEDVEFVKEQIRQKTGIQNFLVSEIGPVVGSHSGPDTVALFFLGTGRKENV